MNTKNLFKLIGTVILFAAIGGTGSYILWAPHADRTTPGGSVSDSSFGWRFPVAKFPSTGPGDQIAYSDIRDPGGIPQGLPVRLKIPIIGVDSAIEDALITPDGRMDVPAGSVNVAWFSLGPYPGRPGSAVIGGHFGISNGVPFVFYKLDQLKIGDKIYVIDDRGATLAFQVRSSKLFDRNADATTVFTSNDGLAHLNLITCEGVWNRVNDTYPERRVVFTDAIPAEGVLIPTLRPTPVPTVYRSLRIGMRGADVVDLQTALEQQGFLRIPRGVTKGYFGTLTRTAVAKYQTSVGLPSNGVLDSVTRAQLFPQPAVAQPALPSTAGDTPSLRFTRALRDLYATPLDGLITSTLLILIFGTVWRLRKKQL